MYLQIEFSSLIDVRIIKSGDPHLETAITPRVEAPMYAHNAVLGMKHNNNNAGTSASVPGGELNISQVALSGAETNINGEMATPTPGISGSYTQILRIMFNET